MKISHTHQCRRLQQEIDDLDEAIADLSEHDAPDLPEVGEEIDELDAVRGQRVDLLHHLHASGQCTGGA